MNITKYLIINALLAALFLCSACEPKETKEPPPPSAAKNNNKKVTVSDIERGIRANINASVAEGDGFFNFTNDTTKFRLKLVRVHTEYLSVLKPAEFFACVDLATEEGDVYDVDFFLKGSSDSMIVTGTTLQKLNVKTYYT